MLDTGADGKPVQGSKEGNDMILNMISELFLSAKMWQKKARKEKAAGHKVKDGLSMNWNFCQEGKQEWSYFCKVIQCDLETD